jgi:tetratricopeptide (TPR) repeat protein
VDQGTGRYAAFLSYSHNDAAAARWLHRRLETYRIPKRLVGAEGEWGPVPARLTPIFRDREELAAGGDLSERVRAALAASDHLVILCSPTAAASPWVAKEIAAFRELHPARPVFAAIVEGDPSQCFPPNLAAGGAEPLAADLRSGRDGRRLGFLKLVAGLSGTGLDALVQRDAQRRVRRVMAVTAAALAAMLVMAVLTVFALSARREAQRQRAEAEGLVEFMLTDLRDRLKGVGSLYVMNAVNDRALRYYGGRPNVDALSDDSLARRARILQAMGDDDLERDDLDGALRAFQEASRTTREQLARAPTDTQRLFEHAKSDYGIGRVHELRRDWPVAQQRYAAFAAAADRILESAPDNPEYLGKAAAAAINLGNVQFNGPKNYGAAQGFYEKAAQLLERADRAKPDDLHILLSLANADGWLADSFYMRCLWDKAEDARLQQYAIVERLHKSQPVNAEIWFRLAAAQRGLAYALLQAGETGRARTQLVVAHASMTRLTHTDPANVEWRRLGQRLSSDLVLLDSNPPLRQCKPAQQDRPEPVSRPPNAPTQGMLSHRSNPRA